MQRKHNPGCPCCALDCNNCPDPIAAQLYIPSDTCEASAGTYALDTATYQDLGGFFGWACVFSKSAGDGLSVHVAINGARLVFAQICRPVADQYASYAPSPLSALPSDCTADGLVMPYNSSWSVCLCGAGNCVNACPSYAAYVELTIQTV